ncbi:hypothetical protein O3M35_011924 [Rhynocoris fuscipes]|uniref:ATP-dependent RNA helicase DHX34 n=1 Tax=Rhynocoris fuscipes TaxID=488301 RepID=A0AAW1D4Q3_9HEMI
MSRDEKLNYQYYRKELFKNFHLNEFINDIEDFWLFVKKYESVQQKAKQLDKKIDHDALHKSLIEKLNLSEEEKKRLQIPLERKHSSSLSFEKLKNFQTILFSYLDFKKKEKESLLLKIKEIQNNLPVSQFRDEIVNSVKENRVTIIAGDTGCGKSTQVPRFLLESGFNRIACTQPRRIACISLAKRVAYETQNKFGEKVGYQIRFERKKNRETSILFITEGLLLRQVGEDGLLADYDVIVLDEIHERHLQGDLLLGVLKCLLYQRKDLNVVLMSATINLNLFATYFSDDISTKVIEVPGRLHPIKVQYMPIPSHEVLEQNKKFSAEPYIRIMQLIDSKYPSNERGDLLMFVSGFSEINAIIDAGTQYNEKAKKWIILPLHSSLSIAEQDKVFDYAPEGMRKCVVSTNIAETSVTIDGIRFVVDSGFAKEMSYDPQCKLQRLKEMWISKASAEQRKGRAGRTGPGSCYRLYTEADYAAMADFTPPEIHRVPLDSLLLQMIAIGLPDARKFPFIEPPPIDYLENTIHALKQHGALTEDEKITSRGSLLSRLPVDIPIGKMLLSGTMFHQIEPALSLAAALSVQTPYTNKAYRDSEAQTLLNDIESDHGDPITLLNLFKEWLEVKGVSRKTNVSSKQWCRRRGLEEQRFYEMTKIRDQFKQLLRDCSMISDENQFTEENSSAERALRHGEVKLLKSLKRKHDKDEEQKRRKILRVDSWTIEPTEDANGNANPSDIRDIDFRLSNNHTQLQHLITGSTACSFKDLTILKIILCSGLYPQIAIADEYNHHKGINDQLFHTQSKPFVFLHPMSYFGNHPESLHLSDSDIVQHPQFNSKAPLSSRHQILFYMSLLETNKPYLVNTLRMPAAQSLLLFCNQMHTNGNFSKVVCDSWIEITFAECSLGERLIIEAIKLRSIWDQLTTSKLQGESSYNKLENSLSEGLLRFMNFSVDYSIRRLLMADLKTLYVGEGYNCYTGVNPFLTEFSLSADVRIGGTLLTPYLTYDCLNSSQPVEDWQCLDCGLYAPLNTLQKHQHLTDHGGSQSNKDDDKNNEITSRKPNSLKYFCDKCDKDYHFTPVEILKHKKTHLINN